MTEIMSNKQIKRELDYGERKKFYEFLGMCPRGYDMRMKNQRPEMNLSYAYAKFREMHPREED